MIEDDCQFLGVHMRLLTRWEIWFTLGLFANYYFGGARSKGFATLRNVSKLTFFDKIGFSVLFGFDEVRAELVRDISRSLQFL